MNYGYSMYKKRGRIKVLPLKKLAKEDYSEPSVFTILL